MTDHNDNSFAQFQLPAALFTNLVRMGFNRPTPVQTQAIPFALEGRDVLGSAQTGTGKTAAFAIPVVARLMEDRGAAALIMTPTRELAAQILSVIRDLLGADSGIRTALLIGGESMGRQFDQLRSSPRIIIGTPGRLNDHLRRDPALLEDVQMVVLDEADRMLDMGFSGQIDEVLEHVRKPCQMLMFSATFPPAIIKFSKTYLNDPQRIAIAPESRTAARVRQTTVNTTEDEKYNTLVRELDARKGSIIVFVRTKHGADRMARRLAREKHSADAIHGDLRQNKRDRAIASFRDRKTRIMVATDVAARGIDVPHIEHVINYDLPQVAEDYIHRIGRTARAGAEGEALSILLPSDAEKWNAISRVLDPSAPLQNTAGGGRSAGPRRRTGPRREKSYRREGGFNERKPGEGFSHKKAHARPDDSRRAAEGPARKPDRDDGGRERGQGRFADAGARGGKPGGRPFADRRPQGEDRKRDGEGGQRRDGGGHEGRPGKRYEARPDNRQDNRREGRPDNRHDSRQDSRPDNRQDRSGGKGGEKNHYGKGPRKDSGKAAGHAPGGKFNPSRGARRGAGRHQGPRRAEARSGA